MEHADTGAGLPSPPANTPGNRQPRGNGALRQGAARLPIGLLGLLILGDFLFWHHAPGLSLAIFAAGVFAATAWARGRPTGLLGPALLLTAAALPIIEHVQALSGAFLAAGLLLSLAWLRAGGFWRQIGPRSLGLLAEFPLSGFRALGAGIANLHRLATDHPAASSGHFLRNWAFPLGGALVLMTLLTQANPVLESGIARAFSLDIDLVEAALRLMFWTGLGLVAWPLIAAPAAPVALRLPGDGLSRRLGLNRVSVRNALVIFNLILAVQTLLDLSIFLGGAALPVGMTYATYAHRGAYPLLATAVLAGGFAVAAQPFLDRGLRVLMLVWLAQTLALSASSALRLDLYVEAYGLTYLRLHALIWIGLVAAGLALTAWQTLRALPTPWLIRRGLILSLAVLYACSFINFAAIIARENLARWPRVDAVYLCSLGPPAAGEVARAASTDAMIAAHLRRNGCDLAPTPPAGWREWGFRQWRVGRYAAAELPRPPDEASPRR